MYVVFIHVLCVDIMYEDIKKNDIITRHVMKISKQSELLQAILQAILRWSSHDTSSSDFIYMGLFHGRLQDSVLGGIVNIQKTVVVRPSLLPPVFVHSIVGWIEVFVKVLESFRG